MQAAPRRPIFLPLIAAAITLASPLFSTSARANLVVNGNFDTGAGGVGAVVDSGIPGQGAAYQGGQGSADILTGSFYGWTTSPASNVSGAPVATNANIYFAQTAGLNSGPLTAYNPVTNTGGVAAVLPDFPSFTASISQAITGVVATSLYNISFWVANQDNGQGSNSGVGNNYLTVNFGGAALTGGTPPIPGAIPVPTNWTQYTFTNVVAPSDSAILSFVGGNVPGGTLISDVDVEAVPEVSSFGMVMGLGLFAFGAAVRVRRRSPMTA
jgi:hypothetical protein